MSKIKTFGIKTFKEVKKLASNIIKTDVSRLRLITVISLLIKTILFYMLIQIAAADYLDPIYLDYRFSFVYLAFILLFYSFGYLFSKNKIIVFQLLYNFIYSAILIADLWYYRVNNDLYGLRNIFYPDTFNISGESLINIRPIDFIFLVDILLILAWIVIKRIKCNENKSIDKFSFTIRYSIIMILISYIALDVVGISDWDARILKSGWDASMTTKAPGVIGYHLVEAGKTIGRKLETLNTKEDEEIENWIEYNKEDLEPNEYEGVAKGKNVIFLQIESLENFVINQTANGKEITPFLNKLTREGLYFNNFYEQNNAGNSIDCDFLVNTSIMPLGDKITALNYGTNIYSNSLSRVLNSEGYTTISTHAEDAGEFNWTELHANGFGSDKIWNINDYVYEESVGYGLSDRSFLSQIATKVEDEEEPFFIQVPTLSSHGPFNISSKYRELDLPEEIDESYLGGYFESVHYTDKQIEMFFNMLEEEGLLDNSIIVLYGDHTGVHKYYNDDIQELSYEGDWWKEVDHKIPLIIYSKDMPAQTIEAHGGQVDLLPTISYLLGIDKDKYENTSMGRVLVNTNRDATVIKGNTIVGNVQNKEEEEHLLNAYYIGEKIIKKDYFSK